MIYKTRNQNCGRQFAQRTSQFVQRRRKLLWDSRQLITDVQSNCGHLYAFKGINMQNIKCIIIRWDSFNDEDDENFSTIPDNLSPMSRAIVDIRMLSKQLIYKTLSASSVAETSSTTRTTKTSHRFQTTNYRSPEQLWTSACFKEPNGAMACCCSRFFGIENFLRKCKT